MNLENDEWLIAVAVDTMGGHWSKEKTVETIKDDFINDILFLDKRLFASAKLIHKKSGQVIDLLS